MVSTGGLHVHAGLNDLHHALQRLEEAFQHAVQLALIIVLQQADEFLHKGINVGGAQVHGLNGGLAVFGKHVAEELQEAVLHAVADGQVKGLRAAAVRVLGDFVAHLAGDLRHELFLNVAGDQIVLIEGLDGVAVFQRLDVFAHLAVVEHLIVPAEHLAEDVGVVRHELEDAVEEVDVAALAGDQRVGVKACKVAFEIGDVVFQTDQGINAFNFVLGQLGNAEAVHECVEIRRLVGDPAIEPVQNDTGDLKQKEEIVQLFGATRFVYNRFLSTCAQPLCE